MNAETKLKLMMTATAFAVELAKCAIAIVLAVEKFKKIFEMPRSDIHMETCAV